MSDLVVPIDVFSTALIVGTFLAFALGMVYALILMYFRLYLDRKNFKGFLTNLSEKEKLEYVKKLAAENDKSFGGNLKLTSVLLFGTQNNVKRHTVDVMDLGGESGFVLAPGCDLPFNCPEENLAAVTEMVHDEYQRDIVRTMSVPSGGEFDDIQLPDYARSSDIMVEVVTLDSVACTPCQYMLEAAVQAANKFGDRVKIREHKIKTRSGIGYMKKLQVISIPSICIDGEVEFSSIIPDKQKLEAIYAQKLEQKNK